MTKECKYFGYTGQASPHAGSAAAEREEAFTQLSMEMLEKTGSILGDLSTIPSKNGISPKAGTDVVGDIVTYPDAGGKPAITKAAPTSTAKAGAESKSPSHSVVDNDDCAKISSIKATSFAV